MTIKCPLPEVEGRMYLCRQMAESRACATVVSNRYTKDEYKSRVTLTQRSERHQFLVKMTELTESDSGIYACGVGINTDRGKTKKVALNVHSAEYEPFWEEEPTTKPPRWLYRLPRLQMPHRFQMPVPGSSFRLTPKGQSATVGVGDACHCENGGWGVCSVHSVAGRAEMIRSRGLSCLRSCYRAAICLP